MMIINASLRCLAWKKTKTKNKQSKRKSLSSLKIILPHSALYSITLTPQFFCKEGRVNRDVCYCFMAMKCGANAEPPSDDPCAACLGPGFISIMRSIYSAAMTPGYEKKPDSFKNTGTSAKSCLKGRANSQMKLAWYVCSHKVVNCAREKQNKKTADRWPNRRRRRKIQRIYEYCSGQDYAQALDLISRLHRVVIAFVFTLKPQYSGVFTVGVWGTAASLERFKIPSMRFTCFWSQPPPLRSLFEGSFFSLLLLQTSLPKPSRTRRGNEISPFIY